MNAIAHWVKHNIDAPLLKTPIIKTPGRTGAADKNRRLHRHGPRITEMRERGMSFPQIGREFGLSHSTVCSYFHGYKALKDEEETK